MQDVKPPCEQQVLLHFPVKEKLCLEVYETTSCRYMLIYCCISLPIHKSVYKILLATGIMSVVSLTVPIERETLSGVTGMPLLNHDLLEQPC